jgi:RNA 2',3'-cyclic 3'-phosphodiesterase
MRVFLAIDLPKHIRGELERLQENLPVGRLVPSDNLHLTLSFLGEQSAAVCEDAHEALSDVHAKPFYLRLAGLGTFGKNTPQLIYADVERCQELIELERTITRKLRSAGVPFQKRRFRPHVTIARLSRTLSASGLAKVQNFIATHAHFQGSPFQVREFHFYCSILTPEQAHHEVLATYDLSNPEIDVL